MVRAGHCSVVHICPRLHRYRDPDADHREDFDGPPVEKRAQRRFNKRFSKTTDEVGPHVVQPAIEHEEGGEGGLGRKRRRKRLMRLSSSAPATSLSSATVKPTLAHHTLCFTRANTIRIQSI